MYCCASTTFEYWWITPTRSTCSFFVETLAVCFCGSEDPEAAADRYDLDVADVYHALAYYHDHPREMHTVEQEREDAMEDFRRSINRPEGVDPDAA